MDLEIPKPYFYALILVIGILFITPILGLGIAALGAPIVPVLLGLLTLILTTFGIYILHSGDVYRGLLVMILVLGTMRANFPFGAFPGGTLDVGPHILLVDGALLLFLAITASSWSRKHFTKPTTLLLVFVVWCVALTLLAPGPRQDVMGWYAVHVGRYALLGLVVIRGVIDNHLTGREALGVIGIAATGQAMVATGQIVTGPINPLSVLGSNLQIVASIGSIPTGPYVGGFMGGAPLAVLLTLLWPAVIGIGVARERLRIPVLLVVVWWAVLLQFTAWDAVRGALLVALGFAFVLFGWWATGILWSRGQMLSQLRRTIGGPKVQVMLAAALVGLAASIQLFVSSGGPIQPRYLGPETGQAWAKTVDIPGFSTKNLAIRIYQYVAGIDVFLQYPLTGVGGANFPFVAEAYGRAITMHNLYIGTLAETGIVGAILLFGALWVAARRLWWLAEKTDDSIMIGLLAGLGGVFAMQFFQPQYLRIVSMMSLWMVLGAVVGEVRRQRGAPDDYWQRAWNNSVLTAATRSARITNVGEQLVESATRLAGVGYEYYRRSKTARVVRKFY